MKILAGLVLLLAIYGLSHQTFKRSENKSTANLSPITSNAPLLINEVTSLLNVKQISEPQRPLALLNTVVPPATTMQLSWQLNQILDGLSQPTPVLVVNGARVGPTLCLTAAVHGDELNGIEIVRRIIHTTDPEKLSGTIIGVPIVNLQGFQRASRYLTDRRDLNRFFPGHPQKSLAARIAHSFFNDVILHCQFLVDMHTGSSHRTNLPQIRANLDDPDVVAFAQAFGMSVILHSVGSEGMLRYAALEKGIPSVTMEAGKSLTLQEEAIKYGVKSINILLSNLAMLENDSPLDKMESIYYHSNWVRVDHGGFLFSTVKLGEEVSRNKVLGIITDPITNLQSEIISPYNGRIIGMAVDQVVMPGFASFHIGIQESEEKVARIDGEIKKLPLGQSDKIFKSE